WPLLLTLAALDARLRAEPLLPATPQGQAWQPLQRLERGGARRRLGTALGRGGAGSAHHPRDGEPYAARSRDRRRRHAAAGAVAGGAPLRVSQRARPAPRTAG